MNLILACVLVITTFTPTGEVVTLNKIYESKEQCEFVKEQLNKINKEDKIECVESLYLVD